MALNFNKYEQPAYWTQTIQYYLDGMLHRYLKDNNMTQQELADKLQVSKGYISKILNGEFDHKLSKLVELGLACDMVPKFEFVPKKYADIVLKGTYLSNKDWENYGKLYESSLPLFNDDANEKNILSAPSYIHVLSNATYFSSIENASDWSKKEETKLNAA